MIWQQSGLVPYQAQMRSKRQPLPVVQAGAALRKSEDAVGKKQKATLPQSPEWRYECCRKKLWYENEGQQSDHMKSKKAAKGLRKELDSLNVTTMIHSFEHVCRRMTIILEMRLPGGWPDGWPGVLVSRFDT